MNFYFLVKYDKMLKEISYDIILSWKNHWLFTLANIEINLYCIKTIKLTFALWYYKSLCDILFVFLPVVVFFLIFFKWQINTKTCQNKLSSYACSVNLLNKHHRLYLFIPLRITGRVDKASTTETVDLDSILGRTKANTIKTGIHSFPAKSSAWKGRVWSLHRVWQTRGQVAAWLEDRKDPLLFLAEANWWITLCNHNYLFESSTRSCQGYSGGRRKELGRARPTRCYLNTRRTWLQIINMNLLHKPASWSRSAVTLSFLQREVWGSNLGLVKLDRVLPTARNGCGISSKEAELPDAMTWRWAQPTCNTLQRITASILKDSTWFDLI